MICSMNRKGGCWDNAPLELLRHLKRQNRDTRADTKPAARNRPLRFIEDVYNRRCLPSGIGCITPVQQAMGKVTLE
jgi:hypothetical protein